MGSELNKTQALLWRDGKPSSPAVQTLVQKSLMPFQRLGSENKLHFYLSFASLLACFLCAACLFVCMVFCLASRLFVSLAGCLDDVRICLFVCVCLSVRLTLLCLTLGLLLFFGTNRGGKENRTAFPYSHPPP